MDTSDAGIWRFKKTHQCQCHPCQHASKALASVWLRVPKRGTGHNIPVSSVLDKFRVLRIHRWRKSIDDLSRELNPVIRGVMNYYCKFWSYHTHHLWTQLNKRLLKWVKWEKGLYKKAALRWLKKKYEDRPNLFAHWKLVHP